MPNIKKIRKSQNLNAMELAQKAGLDLNQPLMSAMESGKVLPTPHDLQAVCEALQCTPMDLFDSVEEFDLMAVQMGMDGSAQAVDVKPKELTRFDSLPPANPKREFRMSDKDWNKLQWELQCLGYNSVGKYLKDVANCEIISIA